MPRFLLPLVLLSLAFPAFALDADQLVQKNIEARGGLAASYEGRPAQTLLDRTTVLEDDLAAITAEFDALAASRVPALNARLGERKRAPMVWPAAPVDVQAALSGGVAGGTSGPERFARNPLWHVRLR